MNIWNKTLKISDVDVFLRKNSYLQSSKFNKNNRLSDKIDFSSTFYG